MPPLLEKASLQADLVHLMEAQHEALATVLERIEKLMLGCGAGGES
jgi:hypothetical protein